MNESIIIVGSINMDLVIRTPRMPLIGETLSGYDFHVIPGGKGANQAVAIARQGGQGVMLGCIGDDDFGRQQQRCLQQEGIDLSCLSVIAGCATGVASITVDDAGQNSIILASGANDQLSPEHIWAAEQGVRKAGLMVCQLEIPFETVRQSIALAHRYQIPIILNPAPAPSYAIPRDILEQVTYLIPNEVEASQLSGVAVTDPESARTAALHLHRAGCQTVLVTLGSHGVVVAHDGETEHYPAIPVHAVDTTAAGDVFVGGFAVALMEGKSLADSVLWAQHAASLSVTQLGAQSSIPTRQQVAVNVGRA